MVNKKHKEEMRQIKEELIAQLKARGFSDYFIDNIDDKDIELIYRYGFTIDDYLFALTVSL